MKFALKLISAFAFCSTVSLANAEETAGERAKGTVNQATTNIKKGMRAAKDKACEVYNDKGECIKQKMGHKIDNAKDTVRGKAEEVKDKVD